MSALRDGDGEEKNVRGRERDRGLGCEDTRKTRLEAMKVLIVTEDERTPCRVTSLLQVIDFDREGLAGLYEHA